MLLNSARCLLLLVITSLSTSEQATVGQASTESRNHFSVRGPKDEPLYTLTVVRQSSPIESRQFVLMEDSRHNEFVFSRVTSFADHTGTWEIREPRRKAFIKVTEVFPEKATTRDDWIEEAEANLKAGRTTNRSAITIETGSFARAVRRSDFDGELGGRELRTEIREGLDPVFVEALERMRGFIVSDLITAPYCQNVLKFVLHGYSCPRPSGTYVTRQAEPECSFDAGFGFPCSPEQRDAVEKAKKAGGFDVGWHY